MKRKIVYIYFSVLVVIFSLLFSVSIPYAANDYELYIAQGIEKINEKNYSEAIALLKRALELSPENSEAAYYAAIAYSRLGELEKAEELFLKILKENETAVNVYLELGRIYYVKTECTKSQKYLSKFISISDNELLKNYASNLIENCSEADKAAGKKKSYNLSLTVGSQYDDNVIVESKNPTAPADRKEDGRVVAYLTAGATLLEKGVINLKAKYNFYHSLHFELNDFNIQYHKITPALEMEISDVFKPSIGYSYEYTLLGGERYSSINTFFANAAFIKNEGISTELIYKYRDIRFRDSDLFKTNSARTGHRNTFGLKQNFTINKLIGDIYLFSDYNRAEERYWAYNGYSVGADLVYQIISPLYLTVSGELKESWYRDNFPDFEENRLDTMQHYSVVLTYRISRRLSIYLSEDYTKNDSNLNLYEYDRNIISAFLRATIL